MGNKGVGVQQLARGGRRGGGGRGEGGRGRNDGK